MSSTDKDLLTEIEHPGQLTPPDRVSYDEGVLLDALDFRAEQSYHRGRLARVLTYLFGTGTAAGLEVVWEKPLRPGDDAAFPEGREERLRLKPGLAIDRLGRLIEVPRDWCIRLDRWYRSHNPGDLKIHGGAVVADVFLRFLIDERGRTPGFASGPFDALDASVPSPLRDAFAVDLIPRPEPGPDPPQSNSKYPSWPDLAAVPPADRRDALHQALLGAWREGTFFLDDQGRIEKLAEHVLGKDTTSVFLARVSLPAEEGPPPGRKDPFVEANKVVVDNLSRRFVLPADPDAGGRPVRRAPSTDPVTVDNLLRRFAHPAGALAALQGIRLAGDTP